VEDALPTLTEVLTTTHLMDRHIPAIPIRSEVEDAEEEHFPLTDHHALFARYAIA